MGVLGCALLDNACLPEVAGLPVETFFDTRHRAIFAALLALHRDGAAVDGITLHQRLKDAGQLEAAGGDPYVAQLPARVPSAANLPAYLDTVREKLAARQALATAQEVTAAVLERPNRVADIARHATEAFASIHRTAGDSRNGFTVRRPDEILAMRFDDADNILGDRLLATGQSLVIAGAGGVGKSRLLLQLAACCLAGRDFVGFVTRGHGLRWLVLQAENSNRRLHFDLATLRDWIGPTDWAQVDENLFIHTLETDTDGFLTLDSAETTAKLGDLIAQTEPHIVAFDPLYAFAVGDLNKDEDMRATLTAISRLARAGHPGRMLVVLHHALTGKAGAARATGFDRASFGRNSKVLQAWTRAQVNVAPGTPDNAVLVFACGKCSNGREFEPVAIRLNPQSMTYEPAPDFDVTAWQGQMTGRGDTELMNPERVRELCNGPLSKGQLAKLICNDCGCHKATAYRHIQRAEKRRCLQFNKTNECYTPR